MWEGVGIVDTRARFLSEHGTLRASPHLGLYFQREEEYIPYPSIHEVSHSQPPTASLLSFSLHLSLLASQNTQAQILCLSVQVLRKGWPYPLIILPQFGGYWIEGTNHSFSNLTQAPSDLPSPCSGKVKLECDPTAKLYRKYFLGKVRGTSITSLPTLPSWLDQTSSPP